MKTDSNNLTTRREILLASLLVAGNLLGVGILALPIKIGVSGYLPSLLDIVVIAVMMLISAFVIAHCIPSDQEHFDIPSFFHKELGIIGQYLAVICNLILLYGVLVVYLSIIASILHDLLPVHIHQWIIIVGYFTVVTILIDSEVKFLQKSNAFLLLLLFAAFLVLITTGSSNFTPHLLTYMDWRLLPIGLPVAVSTFHFHNIIPTIKKMVHHDRKALYKTISIGVLIGFVINVTWITIVLGSLPAHSTGDCNLCYAFLHGQPATVPMTILLHSKVFGIAGIFFAILAVTASYIANGLGLIGFIGDLTSHYLKRDNKLLIASLAFIPPLIITLFNPNIFLAALDIVGGIGETILFLLLPGIILARIAHRKATFHWASLIAYSMIALSSFIVIYIVLTKLGVVNLGP